VYRERLSRDSFSVFTSLLGWRGYYVRESDSKYGSRGSLAKTLFVKKGHLPTARGLILMEFPVDRRGLRGSAGSDVRCYSRLVDGKNARPRRAENTRLVTVGTETFAVCWKIIVLSVLFGCWNHREK